MKWKKKAVIRSRVGEAAGMLEEDKEHVHLSEVLFSIFQLNKETLESRYIILSHYDECV